MLQSPLVLCSTFTVDQKSITDLPYFMIHGCLFISKGIGRHTHKLNFPCVKVTFFTRSDRELSCFWPLTFPKQCVFIIFRWIYITMHHALVLVGKGSVWGLLLTEYFTFSLHVMKAIWQDSGLKWLKGTSAERIVQQCMVDSSRDKFLFW